jgi:hypothetical protein
VGAFRPQSNKNPIKVIELRRLEVFRRQQGNKGLIPADTRLDHAPASDPVRPRSNALSWRDDWFFFFAAWIIAAVIVYGFAQTVSQRLLHASDPRPLILWLHVAACNRNTPGSHLTAFLARINCD